MDGSARPPHFAPGSSSPRGFPSTGSPSPPLFLGAPLPLPHSDADQSLSGPGAPEHTSGFLQRRWGPGGVQQGPELSRDPEGRGGSLSSSQPPQASCRETARTSGEVPQAALNRGHRSHAPLQTGLIPANYEGDPDFPGSPDPLPCSPVRCLVGKGPRRSNGILTPSLATSDLSHGLASPGDSWSW